MHRSLNRNAASYRTDRTPLKISLFAMLVGGVFVVGSQYRNYRAVQNRQLTATTQGTLLYFGVGDGRALSHARAEFIFKHEGTEFKGTEFTADPDTGRSRAYFQPWVEAFQAGRPVTVYYNPSDPTHSSLERPEDTWSSNTVLFTVLGSVLLTVGAVLGFSFWLRGRGK